MVETIYIVWVPGKKSLKHFSFTKKNFMVKTEVWGEWVIKEEWTGVFQ